MRLPDGDGLDLVSLVQEQYPDLPIAVITAHANMETAITALKLGAFDFVSKPINLQMLRDLISTAIKLSTPVKPNKITSAFDALLGKSKPIENLRDTIAKVARSQAPIYICGPSGTGKELVANVIHNAGPRADQPFIPVNCGAIPRDLMESEFFGHKKGSFTGAHNNKIGLFQEAHHGTLFLDEVADLPLDMQVKLLRAIQEKAIRPIGENKEIPVDIRILSATHKNLHELVNKNEFRQDLFYRLNVIELKVPSLKEREQDIPLLVEHFLARLAKKDQSNPTLTDVAFQSLKEYSFPGNIRELENILERAYTLCNNHEITEHDLQLPEHIQNQQSNLNHNLPLDSVLGDIERDQIIAALEKTKWNKTQAAKLLGISFRALRYRLKKLGLD